MSHPLILSSLVLVAAALAFPTAARAGTVTLDLNLASYHTQAWARGVLNQSNPGIGVTYLASRTWASAVGVYRNSYRRTTAYAMAQWTPVHLGAMSGWHADAGLAAGLATGYHRDEVPCAPAAMTVVVRIASPGGVGVTLYGMANGGRHDSGFVGLQLSAALGRRGGAQ